MGNKEPKARSGRPLTPATKAMFIFAVLMVFRLVVFRPELASDGKPRITVLVTHVIDGDTFELDDGTRVRMLGIDAPEAGFGDKIPQPYSAEATQWLKDRIEGRQVAMRIDFPKTDRYGRTLAWVFEPDGTLVNELILREGRVKLLADFGLPADLEPNLRKAEAEARIRKVGIWARKTKK